MPLANKYVVKIRYDFDVDGGAASVITPAIGESLPNGAIITNVVAIELTAFTSGGSATVQLKAGSTAITDALAFDSGFTAGNTLALVSSATAVALSSNGALTLTVATAALTAGKVDFYVEYMF